MQLESESSFRQLDHNTFPHLPSPQGVCHNVFSLNSSYLIRMSKQLGGKNPCNLHSTEPRDTHHITKSQLRLIRPLPQHCTVLRQKLATALLALTNCEFLATSPLLPQFTSTSSHLHSSLRSGHFFHNLFSHSYVPTVSERLVSKNRTLQTQLMNCFTISIYRQNGRTGTPHTRPLLKKWPMRNENLDQKYYV